MLQRRMAKSRPAPEPTTALAPPANPETPPEGPSNIPGGKGL
jgi:hypothetical protein